MGFGKWGQGGGSLQLESYIPGLHEGPLFSVFGLRLQSCASLPRLLLHPIQAQQDAFHDETRCLAAVDFLFGFQDNAPIPGFAIQWLCMICGGGFSLFVVLLM